MLTVHLVYVADVVVVTAVAADLAKVLAFQSQEYFFCLYKQDFALLLLLPL